MRYYQWRIRTLKQCAEEHKNDKTPTGCLPVSYLCKDTANILERLEQEPTVGDIKYKIERLKAKIRKEHDYGMDAVYGSYVIDGMDLVLKMLDEYEGDKQ